MLILLILKQQKSAKQKEHYTWYATVIVETCRHAMVCVPTRMVDFAGDELELVRLAVFLHPAAYPAARRVEGTPPQCAYNVDIARREQVEGRLDVRLHDRVAHREHVGAGGQVPHVAFKLAIIPTNVCMEGKR